MKPYFTCNKKWYESDNESGKNLIIRLLWRSRNWENRWKRHTGERIKTGGEIIFFVYNQSCKKKKKIQRFSHLCSFVKKKTFSTDINDIKVKWKPGIYSFLLVE